MKKHKYKGECGKIESVALFWDNSKLRETLKSNKLYSEEHDVNYILARPI